MGRAMRAMGGIATFATLVAAMTSSSNASAYKPHRSPNQREESRLMSESNPATATMCGHNAGGAPSPVACTMAYGKGQVISNVQIVPVFWTYGGKTVDATIMAWAPAYMATLVDSPYLDLLAEYTTTAHGGTQTVTRGTSTQPYTITPTTLTGASIDDTQIAGELAAQVKAGNLPAVTKDAQGKSNTLYMIFFPAGVVISLQGSSSCVDYCGYHSSGTSGSTTYLYSVIPDLSQVQTYTRSDGGTITEPCGYGCSYQASTKPEVEWFNGTVSHEIGEAVSDPVGGKGWYTGSKITDFACGGSKSGNSPGGGEIGDVCVGFYDDEYTTGSCEDTQNVPGTNISAQITWSNALNGCYAANPATAPQCPPGGCVDAGPGPVDPPGDAGGSGSGGSSGSSSGGSVDASVPDATIGNGSSSGGSGSSSGGSGSGSSSGGDNGGSSSSGGDNGGSSSGGSGGSSGGVVDTSDSGANGAAPGSSGSSGCSCTTTGEGATSPFALAGAIMAFGIALGRRSKRRG